MGRYEVITRKAITLTLGTDIAAGVEKFVDIGSLVPRYVQVGNKSVVTRIRAKVSGTITAGAGQPALAHRYLRYLLDGRVQGPAKFDYSSKGIRGWMLPIWSWMQLGTVEEVRGADLAANATSSTRTFTTTLLQFEEPNAVDPLFRCPAVESFKAAESGVYITLRNAMTIKGGTYALSAGATVTIYVDVADVPANRVPVPTMVTRQAVPTTLNELTPSPGPGRFLRVLMASSPVPGDNVGNDIADDLSAYTTIESFGLDGQYPVYQEEVERLLQRATKSISVEKPSPLASQASNSSLFRMPDPNFNFDGLSPFLPLLYPPKGTNFLQAAVNFAAPPKLHANNDLRSGLPGGFFWLFERIDPMTRDQLNAYVGALSDKNGRSILGRNAQVRTDAGVDPSFAPLIINAS